MPLSHGNTEDMAKSKRNSRDKNKNKGLKIQKKSGDTPASVFFSELRRCSIKRFNHRGHSCINLKIKNWNIGSITALHAHARVQAGNMKKKRQEKRPGGHACRI
jgi:hypothetical protein